jgi:uncharacterized membrane protein
MEQAAPNFNMFILILVVLFIISFVLALKSAKNVNEKPAIKDVKRSLDKDRVIFHSRSS